LIACLSCNGSTITNGDGPARTLLVATLRGLRAFCRESQNGKWLEANESLTDHHISALLYEPQSGLLFAGAHGRGLWVSDDVGLKWRSCLDGIGHEHIYTLAVQYRDGSPVLFAGTEPVALYRSDDLGQSWRELPGLSDVPGTEHWTFPPPPHLAHVKNLAFHPSEPETLYVCIEQGALLKSVDDGRTWFEEAGYSSGDDFFYKDNHRVRIAASDPGKLYMCGGDGLYTSPDAGRHWEHLTTRADRIGYPDALFIDPRSDDVLYMAGPRVAPRGWAETGRSDATVMQSDDRGHTWHELNAGLPQPLIGNIEAMGLYNFGDCVALFAGTATGEVFACDEAGEPWYLVAEHLPPISKGGHYRWFLTPEQRAQVETHMRAGN